MNKPQTFNEWEPHIKALLRHIKSDTDLGIPTYCPLCRAIMHGDEYDCTECVCTAILTSRERGDGSGLKVACLKIGGFVDMSRQEGLMRKYKLLRRRIRDAKRRGRVI
uniref:Uncharacterized protein n=1 Tax=viral metagenome TaxID=1070528 RepID=A0A6H1ZRD5_9ZZZZ